MGRPWWTLGAPLGLHQGDLFAFVRLVGRPLDGLLIVLADSCSEINGFKREEGPQKQPKADLGRQLQLIQ